MSSQWRSRRKPTNSPGKQWIIMNYSECKCGRTVIISISTDDRLSFRRPIRSFGLATATDSLFGSNYRRSNRIVRRVFVRLVARENFSVDFEFWKKKKKSKNNRKTKTDRIRDFDTDNANNRAKWSKTVSFKTAKETSERYSPPPPSISIDLIVCRQRFVSDTIVQYFIYKILEFIKSNIILSNKNNNVVLMWGGY